MDDLKKEIGKRIKQCRKEKGMTQKELAREVGCHEGTIRQYENGLRSPRLVSQYAIAKALSVPHESLFTLSAPCTQLGTDLAEVGMDCISRQAAIDAFNTNLNELVVGGEKNAKTVENYLNRVLDKIKCLPSVQLDTYWKEQCQSYEQTINKLRESLSMQHEIKQQAINSSDCIDRRAAIDALDSEITITGRTNAAVVMGYCKLVKDRLERLPSAQPEIAMVTIGRAKGGVTMWYECGACGEPIDICDCYCRKCGRKLKHE